MQSIKEIPDKIKTKTKLATENKTIFTLLIILTVAFSSFGLGRLSKITTDNIPISIHNTNNLATMSNSVGDSDTISVESIDVESPQILSLQIGGKYVGSKNSDKYHAPWCSGAQRIKEENQIWFATKEEAELAGYSPASNCKGI